MILEWLLLVKVMMQWIWLDWLGVQYRHLCWLMLTCLLLKRHWVGVYKGIKKILGCLCGRDSQIYTARSVITEFKSSFSGAKWMIYFLSKTPLCVLIVQTQLTSFSNLMLPKVMQMTYLIHYNCCTLDLSND